MNIFSLLLEKQYKILTFLPEAVLVVDETGKILYANKSAFKLFETQKLKGKNINEYFIVNSDIILNNKEDDFKQILKIVSEEQNTKITDVKVTNVSSGKKKRYILTVIDNTQDHSLLDQLITERQEQKILNHTKNVLLVKMSNYLRSPLHSIIGFSQAMLEGLSGEINDKQKKYLEIMNLNSSDLLIFIDKIIELSQVESDIYKFEYNNFDISALFSVIVNECSVKTKNKDIRFSFNSNDLITQNSYSDKNILKIIVSNLINTAVNSIETGAVSVNISNPMPEFLLSKGFETDNNINEKSYVMFEINCKGIEASQFNSLDVFDPYVQVDKNSKKFLMQSFLLSSTKKYINKLKGDFWIDTQYSNQISFIGVIPVEKNLVENNQA